MFCSNCGEQIAEDANFCPQCGQAIEQISEQIEEASDSDTFTLTVARPYQFYAVNPAIDISLDGEMKCLIQNDSTVEIPISAGPHTILFKWGPRKRKVSVDVSGDVAIDLKWGRASGALKADFVQHPSATANRTRLEVPAESATSEIEQEDSDSTDVESLGEQPSATVDDARVDVPAESAASETEQVSSDPTEVRATRTVTPGKVVIGILIALAIVFIGTLLFGATGFVAAVVLLIAAGIYLIISTAVNARRRKGLDGK